MNANWHGGIHACVYIATFSYDLFVGVFANLLTVVLAVLLRFGFSRFLDVRRLRFFGVQKTRRFNVYYGCIQSGTDLVGALESQEAQTFAELFRRRIPGLGEGDSLLNRLFLDAVKVRGIASCPGTATSLKDSFITLGSPMHTFASGMFQEKLEPRVHFKEGTIVYPGGVTQDTSEAILVKTGRDSLVYFYAAGFNEPATLAASQYLAENWQKLDKRYPKGQSFVLRLRLTDDRGRAVLVSECPLD